ncbi:MAG: multidrug efflux MFS transporter [Chloroflexi bacterium]|nr:multidrug efflux MFS transporter [Chloroflexota bacterium]MYK35257.1 multidrug efflux MFS transporter [Chloroflexota bacterium]
MSSATLSRPVSWKKNLIALWFAQVGTTLGFSFTFPFYPLFFEELGGFTTERAAFWAGLAGWVFGLGMGLSSPIWGVLGDRFGRKLNVLRSLILGGLFLTISGFSQTPFQLMASRFVIGATSGVVPTIMALVAAHTPRERLPFAAGIVQSGLFVGVALGPLLGGIIYDAWGMRAAFIATGAGLWGSALIVIFLVREDFHPAESSLGLVRPFLVLWRLSTSRAMLPLYGVVFLVLAAHLMIQPAVPGLVSIVEGGSDSGTASGIVFALGGIGSAVSAVVMGWLAPKVGLQRVLMAGTVLAALAALVPYFAIDYLTLAVGFTAIALFSGGLSGLVNGLIALRSPSGQHGAAFGSAQLAHAFGVALGPLAGGAMVVTWGLRSVFLFEVATFVLILLAVAALLGGRSTRDE